MHVYDDYPYFLGELYQGISLYVQEDTAFECAAALLLEDRTAW